MLNCDLYDQTGAKKGKLELPDELFGQEVHASILHRALVLQQANRRNPIAHTKTRSEVAISKRKIYRQKGTGNARHASKNANLFRGGGVIFGPRNNRNFSKAMPRAQRRIALFSALSDKANNGKIVGLVDFSAKKPNTKSIVKLLSEMKIGRSALFIAPEKNEMFVLSARNLSNTKVITAGYINVEDLLKYDNVVVFEKAIEKMQEIFKTKEAPVRVKKAEKTEKPAKKAKKPAKKTTKKAKTE